MKKNEIDPEQIKISFLNLSSGRDIADFLGRDYSNLVYHLYKAPDSSHYKTFLIPKRSGGEREICAPLGPLKIFQGKLNHAMSLIYQPKDVVQGFAKGRSIVTNASNHKRQKYVLKVDLNDFFPSIHFGRVRGLFMAYPFKFKIDVATILAQLCCHNKKLPQGAPTSPIISNIICAKMDSNIMALAKKCKCYYTRYADDMTFSTSLKAFPNQIAKSRKEKDTLIVEIGDELKEIIENNSFTINNKKTRLSQYFQSQQVTGLIVNEFPNVPRKYVRDIRAMLHSWRKYGYEKAESAHYEKHNVRFRDPKRTQPSFESIIAGKINYIRMVRGSKDKIFQNLLRQYHKLNPKIRLNGEELEIQEKTEVPLVMTEGKTDWMHLEAALKSLGSNGFKLLKPVDFKKIKDTDGMNDTELLKICQTYSRNHQPRKIICIFDRDNPPIINKVTDNGKNYKSWGNNVYSFAIPTPSHRTTDPKVSIELYYTDDEIKTLDSDGRRLFLSSEFSPKSARHISENLNCTDYSKIHDTFTKIIDCNVYDDKERNVALSKMTFASNILNKKKHFDNFKFDEFIKIFDVINEISALPDESKRNP
jgi:RNA-directed DNA polymerase